MKINLKHGDKLPFCGERGQTLRPHRGARDARGAVGRAGPWLRRLRRSHKDGYVPCRWCPGGSGISDGPGWLLSGGHLGQRLMLHDSIVVRHPPSKWDLWGEAVGEKTVSSAVHFMPKSAEWPCMLSWP
jgi:hypothetical protein